MNWTGGRLQRHSKANANRQVRTQKQYFAKARQNLKTGRTPSSPLALSILNTRFLHERNKPTLQHPTLAPSKRTTHTPEQPASTSSLQRLSKSKAFLSKPTHLQPQSTSLFPKPRTLEDSKRDLLERSDWIGLAASKPVKISFTSAEEMELIGRRRLVASNDTRSVHKAYGGRDVRRDIIRPLRRRDSHAFIPRQLEKDISIRLGSHIHQTESTGQSLWEPASSPAPQSFSSDLMLLDKLETGRVKNQHLTKKEEFYMDEEQDKIADDESKKLIPLNEVLDLTSFDQFLERSTSATPHTPSQNGQLSNQHSQTNVPGSWGSPSDFSSMITNHQSTRSQESSHNSCAADTLSLAVIDHGDPTSEKSFMNAASPMISKIGKSRCGNHGHTWPARTDTKNFSVDEGIFRANSPRTTPEHGNHRRERLRGVRMGPTHSRLDRHMRAFRHAERNSSPLRNRVSIPSSSPAQDPIITNLTLNENTLIHSLYEDIDEYDLKVRRQQQNQATAVANAATRRTPFARSLFSTQIHEPFKPGCATEIKPNFRERFLHHKEQLSRSHSVTSNLHSRISQQSSRVGDANEAWMKDIFPQDFNRIQHNFTFGISSANRPRNISSTFSSLSSRIRAFPSDHSDNGSPSKVPSDYKGDCSSHPVSTAFNATIFAPSQTLSTAATQNALQSQTDFLSQYSPMEGYFDERVADISIYNNATATDRSCILTSGPDPVHRGGSISPVDSGAHSKNQLKRSAEQAFAAPSTPLNLYGSGSSSHRQPLHPISQPHLRKISKVFTLEVNGQPKAQAKRSAIEAGCHLWELHKSITSTPSWRQTSVTPHQQGEYPMSYSPSPVSGRIDSSGGQFRVDSRDLAASENSAHHSGLR